MTAGARRASPAGAAGAATKWVYAFSGPTPVAQAFTEGGIDRPDRLGEKGANLAQMSRLGLPVPPGFTITAQACAYYYAAGRHYPPGLAEQVERALARVGQSAGKRFGDPANPLLVSVRVGARQQMPGLMGTVLNLGLNDATVDGLAERSGDARHAYDCYRRFIQNYGDLILGIDYERFEEILEDLLAERDLALETDLTASDLQALVESYKALVEQELDVAFPQDVREQLWGAIGAGFGSWASSRAITYRDLHALPSGWGAAVTVQAMVFGNMGKDSCCGLATTRDSESGEHILVGDYLLDAQGDDLVAGIRPPQHLTVYNKRVKDSDLPAMEEVMPAAFSALQRCGRELEAHYRDVVQFAFTVQRGHLWVLRARPANRSVIAAVKFAVDLAHEGLIDRPTALRRIEPHQLDQLLHSTIDPEAEREVITRGVGAAPGAAAGCIAFTSGEARRRVERGEPVILVRTETTPEDVHGMHAARGVLTARGGMTSHAAVVARGMGRPCVAGASELSVDEATGTLTVGGFTLHSGETITLDGGTGEVLRGRVPTVEPGLSGDFATLMAWADEARKLGVRGNADMPGDARTARMFGAEGVGLCRTEHMFFDPERIASVRQIIVAESARDRRAALETIAPMQRQDFVELFHVTRGQPVTIRLLDPPLHEFLPRTDHEIEEVARLAGVPAETVKRRTAALTEVNPMLGHRGCRLGISYPEIYEMQTQAMMEAAADVRDDTGETVRLEIMVPLIATRTELATLRRVIDTVAVDVQRYREADIPYSVGTMIELPRACLRGDAIADSADFFSFGTNDLTQTTFGISRDDAVQFLADYRRNGIFQEDPFATLDQPGVGELVSTGVARGRRAHPDLKVGLCGEHGGDPASIHFCAAQGMDYVSCSPFRVPIARLAAAHAALSQGDSPAGGDAAAGS